MSKKPVAIVTDSTACMGTKMALNNDIHIVPLWIHWDGKILRDGVEIQPEEFYQRLKSSTTIPSTSPPEVFVFVDFFNSLLENYKSVLCIFISSELSETSRFAQQAADFIQANIQIVDSRSLATPLAMITLAAAQSIRNGESIGRAKRIAENLVDQMHVIFVVDTLEYLHKGGRIGGAKRFIGSLLSMKPILSILDGKIEAIATIRTKDIRQKVNSS